MKKIIIFVLLIIIYYVYHTIHDKIYHFDYAYINKVKNMLIYKPKNKIELQNFMMTNKRKICVKGSGYSHGGQTIPFPEVFGHSRKDVRLHICIYNAAQH